MNKKLVVSSFIVLLAVLLTLTAAFAADRPAAPTVDATLGYVPEMYVPTAKDLAYNGVTAGDVAAGDIRAVGTSLQYTGLVLNGDGVNPDAPHPFLKVQQQTATGNFEYGGCYLGNNSSAGSFGLGFFSLSQPFNSAHMLASRTGSTVTIRFTNVNGGALPDQTYVCDGAPTPPGGTIGTHGYANSTATIDNFSDGATVLDTFSYVGPLGGTGNWNDAAPGMNANGSVAIGGPLALSFWIGQAGCPPKFIDLTLVQGRLNINLSTNGDAQALYLRIYLADGTVQTAGPFNLPANYCQAIQTNFMPTNPPIIAVVGILYKGPGLVVYDVLQIPSPE